LTAALFAFRLSLNAGSPSDVPQDIGIVKKRKRRKKISFWNNIQRLHTNPERSLRLYRDREEEKKDIILEQYPEVTNPETRPIAHDTIKPAAQSVKHPASSCQNPEINALPMP
jgi:hypothetical protein